jgi:soluble lytic murein transglycosylase-like protein
MKTRYYWFKTYSIILSLLADLFKRISCLWLFVALTMVAPVTNANELTALIGKVEQQYNIPKGLLLAIAKVESRIEPYALNIRGKAIFKESKEAALRVIDQHVRANHTNIDIGVMQINYRWHSGEFKDIAEMIDPRKNIDYAARLLTALYRQHKDWQKAVRLYHSAKPQYHTKYSRKIIIAWLNT